MVRFDVKDDAAYRAVTDALTEVPEFSVLFSLTGVGYNMPPRVEVVDVVFDDEPSDEFVEWTQGIIEQTIGYRGTLLRPGTYEPLEA